jgi:hypothetical protein
MNRPRILRLLRIAASVVCGIACVLLIALWVRSYWWWDSLGHKLHAKCAVAANSFSGQTAFSLYRSAGGTWRYFSERLEGRSPSFSPPAPTSGFGVAADSLGTSIFIPHWMLALIFAACGTTPWFRWRFSLRALLIATTFVAVVLGLVVAFR